MKNGKVVDFLVYHKQHSPETDLQHCASSEELIVAIQKLIQRLRSHEPLKQTG